VHVLMGTLALVAGCSTAQRAEVTGVVRDRATGRAIGGARVVGTDGSLAETDVDGRFHLYVHGALADVNVSARGHSPEHVEIEGFEANVALAPIDESWGAIDESAHVVTFTQETWRLDASAPDATSIGTCGEASLAQAHSGIACASCHARADTVSSCATCHDQEARAIAGGVLGDDAAGAIRGRLATTHVASHDALGGGCLACHGEIVRGDANGSCARCHGAESAIRRAEVGRFFALATSHALDLEADGTRFEMQSTDDASTGTIATWARALARDRSRGIHDPTTTLAIGHALDERR